MTSDYAFDLGAYHRPTATDSADAACWLDRGLVWCYAFNHEEAVRCFERALEADGDFALARWGIAYAAGPNYNKPWDAFDAVDLRRSLRRAHDESVRAADGAAELPAVERELIRALRARYPSPDPIEDLAAWTQGYAEAMRPVYEHHPHDLDVAALYADALMNVTAWALWDIRTGEPAPGARTREARAVLERALEQPGGMEHPGLLHLYVHLVEMSARPEDGLAAGQALRGLVPDAGHLLHMPSHIDVLVGRYSRVVEDNEAAIDADERYLAERGPLSFYSLYRAHNHHFRIYGAMFAGRRRVALQAAEALAAALPEELLRVEVPPMADWLEGFVGMRLHVLIRFGMWEEIVALALPEDTKLYVVTTALTWYAKGVALAALGRVQEALAAQAAFATALERVPESRTLFNNTCRDILGVAEAMLAGEIEYRRGNLEAAWARLELAIERDDTLPYDEPWGWMQPTRHAYGALLLEQGEVERAAAVYAADLGLAPTLPRACQHPGNVWSLHGYHECLQRLGREAEAAEVATQLHAARADADVEIHSSCFCRLSVTS